ncbi:hypothetical protein BS636_13710 [Acinetobacter sp. LoGeW2-3]|uniref:DUF4760 domain-containing protein n=1 Tax=Acinetobacter sp. LoGeW2-3 TaxID=1808001 RepID=UPI000C058DEF|nr:DUF4760 domain-containing protein [Acinetobacter sp. LoGeW2-3]ATO20654.1 hypothetical protein BS636_13710 [Acinetobacter sp. LoGeW2-3]
MASEEIIWLGVSLGTWIQSASVVVAACALFFNALQVRAVKTQNIQNEKKARQRATIDLALHERIDTKFIECRKKFAELRDQDRLTALACEKDNKLDNDAIMGFLNHYEFLACGIFEEAIDGELYKRMMKTSVIRDFDSLKPYIMEIRNQRKNQNIYCEIEKLVDQWR